MKCPGLTNQWQYGSIIRLCFIADLNFVLHQNFPFLICWMCSLKCYLKLKLDMEAKLDSLVNHDFQPRGNMYEDTPLGHIFQDWRWNKLFSEPIAHSPSSRLRTKNTSRETVSQADNKFFQKKAWRISFSKWYYMCHFDSMGFHEFSSY